MARPDGEMAPVKVMCPEPLANTLCIAVLFESRDFTAASFPAEAGECRNIGATRSLESALASSARGSTTSVGPGSTSAMYPRKFTITRGLQHLGSGHQHHLLARMARAEDVHRFPLVRSRMPLAPFRRAGSGEHHVLVGPLRHGDIPWWQQRLRSNLVHREWCGPSVTGVRDGLRHLAAQRVRFAREYPVNLRFRFRGGYQRRHAIRIC